MPTGIQNFLMPSARSRLGDIEGPGLGKPLSRSDLEEAMERFRAAVALGMLEFLRDVDADKKQRSEAADLAIDFLSDLIADATARQLREIEERDDE
jgi:hypothetical protein